MNPQLSNIDWKSRQIRAEGHWGTCPWAIDQYGLLTVYSGTASSLYNRQSPFAVAAPIIRAVNFRPGIDFSKATSMSGLFRNCTKLTYFNPENFNLWCTRSVQSMFENCVSLREIDLSFLQDLCLENTTRMFAGCRNLSYVNMIEWNLNRIPFKDRMFAGCPRHLHINFQYPHQTYPTSSQNLSASL